MAATEWVRGVLTGARYAGRDYDLIVTDRRIVGAVVGSYVGLPILAGFASLPISLGSHDDARERYGSLNLDQILGSNPRNFSIPLAVLQRALLDGGIGWVTLPVLSLWVPDGEYRFEFSHSTLKKDYTLLRYARDVLTAALPGRIQVKRV